VFIVSLPKKNAENLFMDSHNKIFGTVFLPL
jgi:hypothetical protein